MFPTFSFWLSLLFTLNFVRNTITSTLGNETDYLALLKFKESISNDPYMESWTLEILQQTTATGMELHVVP